MFAHWEKRQITYRILSPECDTEWLQKYDFRTVRGLEVINASINKWHEWVPEFTLIEAEAGEQQDLDIVCSSENKVPATGGIAYTGFTLGSGIIVSATMNLGQYALQWGLNAVLHEFGHVLGLKDNTGGIMDQTAVAYTPALRITLEPTQEQITELRATYGALPMPEFGTHAWLILLATAAATLAFRRRTRHA